MASYSSSSSPSATSKENAYAQVFSTIEEAVEDVRRGKFVVVLDDYDRENEGDLIMASEKATAESLAFMIKHTSGFVCVSARGKRLDQLLLPPMTAKNEDAKQTAYAVSVDLAPKHGTTTGISASERAATIRAIADPAMQADDFTRPGHVMPLRYTEGGVLQRGGHTEAAVDLASLAGLRPSGYLCEIVDPDDKCGGMARLPQLAKFALEHGLKMITIADLKAFRQKQELVRRNSEVEGVGVVATASTSTSTSAESERATSAASNAASSAASCVSQTYRSGLLKQKEALLRSLAEVDRLLSQ